VPDASGELVTIERLETSESKEAVGIIQNPEGCEAAQLEEMSLKAAEWNRHVRNGHLPRHLAWQAIRGTVMRSIAHPFPATAITTAESNTAMNLFYREAIPTLGTNRNFPHALRYAPSKYNGLALPNWKWEQEIAHIHELLAHGGATTLTGHFLRADIEQVQLEVGVDTPFFSLPFAEYGKTVTPCWLTCLWEFVSTHGIRLECAEELKLPLQRENDKYLVKCFRSLYASQDSLLRLNRVRVSLQALTLADVTSGDGTTIRQSMIAARPDQWKSRYKWANEVPSLADKSLWAEAMLRISGRQYDLPQRLGDWISEPHKHWGCMYDPASLSLYIKSVGTWWKYAQRQDFGTRLAQQTYTRVAVSVLETPPGEPATAAYVASGEVRFEGSARGFTAEVAEPTSLRDAISALSESWMFEHSDFPNDGEAIADSIRQGSTMMVSDGSYMPHLSDTLGASGWIIEASRTGARCMGSCRTPGDANAYRAELFGIYTMITALSLICQVHTVRSGEVEIEDVLLGCDNEVALWKSSVLESKVPCGDAHADVIRAIRKVRDTLPIKLTYKHIYGHQDDHVDTADLDRPTQLNIECDSLAKRYLLALYQHDGRPEFRFSHEGWRCFVGSCKVTSKADQMIRDHIGRQQVRDYYANHKGSLTTRAFDAVDFEAMGEMLKSKPPTYEMWLTKHVSHFCATGRMMRRMGYWSSSKCQGCEHLYPDREVEETTKHMLVCQAKKMVDSYEDSISEISTWLDKVDTEPALARCIVEYLATRGGNGFANLDNFVPSLLHVAADQDSIGWYNFMEGKVAKAMRLHQDEYYHRQESRRKANRWAAGLVEKIVKMTHSQWTTRNSIVHEKAADGLSKQQSASLKYLIELQFDMGLAGLGRQDHYLLSGGMAEIWARRGPEKMAWIKTIEVARVAEQLRQEREDAALGGRETMAHHFPIPTQNQQPTAAERETMSDHFPIPTLPTPVHPNLPIPTVTPASRVGSTAARLSGHRRRGSELSSTARRRRRTSMSTTDVVAAQTRRRRRPPVADELREEPARQRPRPSVTTPIDRDADRSERSSLDRAERKRRRRRAD